MSAFIGPARPLIAAPPISQEWIVRLAAGAVGEVGSLQDAPQLLAGVGFVAWELRLEHPLLDPRLFRLRGFSAGSLTLVMQFLEIR